MIDDETREQPGPSTRWSMTDERTLTGWIEHPDQIDVDDLLDIATRLKARNAELWTIIDDLTRNDEPSS